MLNPILSLKLLRKQCEREREGHRKRLIHLICEAFKHAIDLQAKPQRSKSFFELAAVPAKRRKRANIVIEVIAYATCSKRKVASKRARAVEYLHAKGVAIEKLEREIERKGGIEAIAREAAQKEPRRKRSSTPARKHDVVAAGSTPTSKGAPALPRNDTKTKVTLEIQVSDLDFIRDLKPGQRIRLAASRLSDGFQLARIDDVRKA